MEQTVKENKELCVQGKGETKASAFASALSTIQKQVITNTEDVILRIEPKDVKVIKAECQTFTERFLFIFFPRQRTSYYVELQVQVEITKMNMKNVTFETKTKDTSLFKTSRFSTKKYKEV